MSIARLHNLSLPLREDYGSVPVMNICRTPEERFKDLPSFHYEPRKA